MSKKLLIAYHANCVDGIMAAAVATRANKNSGRPIVYLPMEYTAACYDELVSKAVEEQIGQLYILDFSIPIEYLVLLNERLESLDILILDHHETAFKRYKANLPEDQVLDISPNFRAEGYLTNRENKYLAEVLINSKMSGADLTEYFFFPNKATELVLDVSDGDLYTFRRPNTRAIREYIKQVILPDKDGLTKLTNTYDVILSDISRSDTYERMVKEGFALYQESQNVIKRFASKVAYTGWLGYRVAVVECPYAIVSEVCEEVYTSCSRPADFVVSYDPASIRIGEPVKLSLRSPVNNAEPLNLGTVAGLIYEGGGGHKHAAGVHVPYDLYLYLQRRVTECLN